MILVTSYIHLQYSPPVKRGNIRQNFPEQGRARVQLVSPDVLRVREDWQFPSSWLCSTSGLDWFAVQTSSGASCLPDAGLGGYWLPVICPSVAESSDGPLPVPPPYYLHTLVIGFMQHYYVQCASCTWMGEVQWEFFFLVLPFRIRDQIMF